jgi:hypothetical protein
MYVRLLHFRLLLQNQNRWANFNQSGDNSNRVKILKIFFSRTSNLISIKLGTNHSYVKGIKNHTNQGPDPFQGGDNHKNAKIGWSHLKIFCPRTTKPE